MTIEYLRQFRFFDFALFDFTLSYLAIIILSPLLTRIATYFHLNLQLHHWLWLTLPLSIGAHVLFSQFTPLTKSAIDPNGHYLLKIVLIGMTYMGLKDILKKRIDETMEMFK